VGMDVVLRVYNVLGVDGDGDGNRYLSLLTNSTYIISISGGTFFLLRNSALLPGLVTRVFRFFFGNSVLVLISSI